MSEADWNSSTDPSPMLVFLQDSCKLSERKARLFAAACCRRVWHFLIDERSRRAVEVYEAFADGAASREQLALAVEGAWKAPLGFHQDIAAWAAAFAGTGLFIPDARAAWVTAQAAAGSAAGEFDRCHAWGASYGGYDIALAEVEGQSAVSWESHVASCAAASKDQATQTELNGQATLLRDLLGPLPFQPVSVSLGVRTWNGGCVVTLAQAAYECRQLPAGTLEPERLAVLADALEEAGCQVPEVLTHLQEQQSHWRGCWVLDTLLGKS
jgi:hypothetical protein